MNLVVHHLRFTLQAQSHIHLGPQAGAQIRGALWAALRQFACTAPVTQFTPEHVWHCPMCRLMALETAQAARGANPPRPFAIQPPLGQRIEEDQLFYPGDTFTIGVNLFGDAADLFPYVCQAFRRMGEIGIGYGRGQFGLIQVQAIDMLDGNTCNLLDGTRILPLPGLPLTQEKVKQAAAALSTRSVTLHFLTPTEIRHQGNVVTKPDLASLIARLLERCQALELYYTADPTPQPLWRERYLALSELAQQVKVAHRETRWVRVQSGSRRTDSRTAVSGFVGTVRFEGILEPFREWLLWGQSVHVGKNAVKGNGWYEVLRS